jgi:hypothetical protein
VATAYGAGAVSFARPISPGSFILFQAKICSVAAGDCTCFVLIHNPYRYGLLSLCIVGV